jgi:hypothetical protein
MCTLDANGAAAAGRAGKPAHPSVTASSSTSRRLSGFMPAPP